MFKYSDELVFKLNAVESTCVADFYTVVDTSRSPVNNTTCGGSPWGDGCLVPRPSWLTHFDDLLRPRKNEAGGLGKRGRTNYFLSSSSLFEISVFPLSPSLRLKSHSQGQKSSFLTRKSHFAILGLL